MSSNTYRKVWRFGLEVARKVKGSQGHRRWEWPRPKHPYTAVSPEQEVYANRPKGSEATMKCHAISETVAVKLS